MDILVIRLPFIDIFPVFNIYLAFKCQLVKPYITFLSEMLISVDGKTYLFLLLSSLLLYFFFFFFFFFSLAQNVAVDAIMV